MYILICFANFSTSAVDWSRFVMSRPAVTTPPLNSQLTHPPVVMTFPLQRNMLEVGKGPGFDPRIDLHSSLLHMMKRESLFFVRGVWDIKWISAAQSSSF